MFGLGGASRGQPVSCKFEFTRLYRPSGFFICKSLRNDFYWKFLFGKGWPFNEYQSHIFRKKHIFAIRMGDYLFGGFTEMFFLLSMIPTEREFCLGLLDEGDFK